MLKSKITLTLALSFIAIMVVLVGQTIASPTSQLTQQINAGVLATDIKDGSRNSVANPAVTMSTISTTFNCATSTGYIGTSTQRIYVDNPGAAGNGWVLSIAGSSTAALWQNSGATSTFNFNDQTGGGCTDGPDADSVAGLMYVNPSVGTLTADWTGGNTNNITKGSQSYFSTTTPSITILTAASNASSSGRWYFTDAQIQQTIPVAQPPGSYTISLTISIVAS